MELNIIINSDLSLEQKIDLLNRIADIIVGEFNIEVANYDIIQIK